MKLSREENKVLAQKLVRHLLKDARLNAWEKEFLSSISSQLLVKDLSEKQLNVLEKIKQKYS